MLIGALIVGTACGSDGASPPSGTHTTAVPGPGGGELAARAAGSGSTAIVLAHGAGTTMESWYEALDGLAAAGYRVIAFDARGVGDSDGDFSGDPADRADDISAVVQHERERGADRVVVMGSSLGAQAALMVAARDDVAAVVGVSPATVPDGLDAITAPGFFVASVGDRGPAANARALGRRFGRPARIVSGAVHGSDLFADHPEALRAVLAFLAEVAPART